MVALGIKSVRLTTRISCRGRLQDPNVAPNQDGGPGQLHPLVRVFASIPLQFTYTTGLCSPCLK